MSSRGGSSSSNGGGLQSIPATSRKVVQSLKEIVNCPESEIYAMLKECNMDPNEAVHKLLSQDPFHEVKSKREKKKENKDATEFRPRGVGSTPNRGGRGGTDRHIGRGGSAHYSSSEYGAANGKPSHKKENGTNNYMSSSFVLPGMAGTDTNRRPPAQCDPLLTEKKAAGTIDGILSSSQPSSGYQPAWSGVPGQISMADIVKMGRSHGKASSTANTSHYGVNHHHVQSPQSHVLHHDLRLSEDHISKVSELNSEPGVSTGYHASPNDEWPLVEQQPAVSVPAVLQPPVACDLHPAASDLSSNRLNQHSQSPQDEFQAVEDAAIENINTNHAGSASVSRRKVQEESSGGAPLFNDDMYKSMGSFRPHRSAFDHQEVEDVGASVSSVASNLQQLNLQGDRESPPGEDNPPVIIPNHLQVQTTECLHLSFGSFGSGVSASFSGSRPLKSKMEEASTDVDASSVGHSETRNLEYYGDEPLGTASDANLVHRTGVNAGSYDLPSASQPEVLQQDNTEAPRENQYIFPSTSNYNFENGQHLNAAFPPQTSSQMQNLPSLPNVTQAYTNSLPSSLLAASVLPARESDVPYSPFPMTQSLSAKYSSTVSSIGGPAIFVTEALKTAGFSSSQQAAQTMPGSGIATGPALPQHLAVHPYSQPTVPLGPFANMISYPFLPQSYTYMPSAFQQAFAGNSTYHQSLAAVLPQYKNSVSVSSLPQSAAIASGYGGFGSSTSIPSNFQMNPTAAPAAASIAYDDVLSSQYKDSNHLMSLQQNENSGMWVQGHGSRTMSAVPGSTYYSFQGQSQQPSGFRQTQQQPSQNYGALSYPNFYHSQTGIPLEHQQQNLRDGSLLASQGQQPAKQSQQIWQNSY